LYMGSDTIEYGTDSNFHGNLDEICIFNKVLDGEDILALAELADCAALEDEPEDTGEPEDTSDPEDTGNPEDSQAPEASTDKQQVGPTGCGCTSHPGRGSWQGLWMVLVLGIARSRRSPYSA
jgi:MYXO-CTERM domain-containing protein